MGISRLRVSSSTALSDTARLILVSRPMSGMRAASPAVETVSGSCQVVFTTSYEHYAFNAFDGWALDYLIKPVSRDH
jgi:two-component SAPR family response regulator